MAMMFDQRKRRKRKHPEAAMPPDRLETEEDLKALTRAKKVEKDLPRHQKVKNLAKEKLAERSRRGKSQATIGREDNVIRQKK